MLAELAGLSEEQIQAWADAELDEDTADRMIENVIGRYSLPIGVATNFIIDGIMMSEIWWMLLRQYRSSDDWTNSGGRMRKS